MYKEITRRLETLGTPVNVVMTFGQKVTMMTMMTMMVISIPMARIKSSNQNGQDNHLNGARLATKANGGGTLLDWGVYCIQVIIIIIVIITHS